MNQVKRIEAIEYYSKVTEVIFDNIKDSSQDGTSIYIHLVGAHFFFTHSTISNNVYYSGAVYIGNCNLFLMKYVCFENNSGFRGCWYGDSLYNSLLSMMINSTSEGNSINQHVGSTLGTNQIFYFNFNNLTKASTTEFSSWYFFSTNKGSTTTYSQMCNTKNNYISAWNSIGSSFNLKHFNYINCSANQMNLLYANGQITYTSCVFFLNCKMGLGSTCSYINCTSDNSIQHNSFKYDYDGKHKNEIDFSDQILCIIAINTCKDAALRLYLALPKLIYISTFLYLSSY